MEEAEIVQSLDPKGYKKRKLLKETEYCQSSWFAEGVQPQTNTHGHLSQQTNGIYYCVTTLEANGKTI